MTARRAPRRSQLVFAFSLRRVASAGLVSAALSYIFYVSGALPGLLSPAAVARLWDQSPRELWRASALTSGSAWLAHLSAGDVLCLATLVFIASGSVLALLRVLPTFVAERNLVHASLVAALIAVIVFAASGLAL